MAPTLPPRVAERLQELRFNAGPIGAGVVLSDRRAETAVAAVMEVEKAIYSEVQVRDMADPDLASGDWISAVVTEMAYGVQETRAAARDLATRWRALRETEGRQPTLVNLFVDEAAVFIARTPDLWLFLSGSAEYLLDRSVPQRDTRAAMSDPQAIMKMLRAVSEDSEPQNKASRSFADKAAYAVAELYGNFAGFGLHPLSFLARVINITKPERYGGATLILGTPLLVEFARPTL